MEMRFHRTIQVLMADDSTAVRECLRALLTREPEICLLPDAQDGTEALQLCLDLKPDIVLMDITMPQLNGIEATRQAVASGTASKILIISMHADRTLVTAALQAGAAGYLLKNHAAKELIPAITAALSGNVYISKLIADSLQEAASHCPTSLRKLLQALAGAPHELRMVLDVLSAPSTPAAP